METVWNKLDRVNEILGKYCLCVPPYQSITRKKISDFNKMKANDDRLCSEVRGLIHNPYQRAYQMEYRYKECAIFRPFLNVIEYAVYDSMNGNWVCAYLSLLPLIEAILGRWADEDSALSFKSMRKSSHRMSEYMKDKEIYTDDRKNWSDSHISYMQLALSMLYESFDGYQNFEIKDVFNRNLTLHKLAGVGNVQEVMRNLSRILLLLDVLAELYLMQDFARYWHTIFYAEPEQNPDFQLRWKLYVKASMLSLGPNDLLIINNGLLNPKDGVDKMKAAAAIEGQIKQIRRH